MSHSEGSGGSSTGTLTPPEVILQLGPDSETTIGGGSSSSDFISGPSSVYLGMGGQVVQNSNETMSGSDSDMTSSLRQVEINGSGASIIGNGIDPVAVYSCCANSHPFSERHIPLRRNKIKIGRAVNKVKALSDNAIFDCKVLSRAHAEMWFENGRFMLMDTNSSNGTFVNGNKIGIASEENPPHEIFSGDLIQFGVNVTENAKKITHGCIVTEVTLYHADGTEAKRPVQGESSVNSVNVKYHELFQLSQCLQEALLREQSLDSKLSYLKELLEETQQAAEVGWKAMVDEDRLLTKLDCLERQLLAYSQNLNPSSGDAERIKDELSKIYADRYSYETESKESIRKILDEKMQAICKLDDVERVLATKELECTRLREMYETSQTELGELAIKYQTQVDDLAALQKQMTEVQRAPPKWQEPEKSVSTAPSSLNTTQVAGSSLFFEELEALFPSLISGTSPAKMISDAINKAPQELRVRIDEMMEVLSSGARARIEGSKVKVEPVEKDEIVQEVKGQEEGDRRRTVVPSPDEVSIDLKDPIDQELIGFMDGLVSKLCTGHRAAIDQLKLNESSSNERIENVEAALRATRDRAIVLEGKLDERDREMNRILEEATVELRVQLREAKELLEHQRLNENRLKGELEERISELERMIEEHRAVEMVDSAFGDINENKEAETPDGDGDEDYRGKLLEVLGERDELLSRLGRLEEERGGFGGSKVGLNTNNSNGGVDGPISSALAKEGVVQTVNKVEETQLCTRSDCAVAKKAASSLSESLSAAKSRISTLEIERKELEEASRELRQQVLEVRDRSFINMLMAMAPFGVLLLAIVFAFRPWLEYLTATESPDPDI